MVSAQKNLSQNWGKSKGGIQMHVNVTFIESLKFEKTLKIKSNHYPNTVKLSTKPCL